MHELLNKCMNSENKAGHDYRSATIENERKIIAYHCYRSKNTSANDMTNKSPIFPDNFIALALNLRQTYTFSDCKILKNQEST